MPYPGDQPTPPPPPPPPETWSGWGPVQIGPREVYDAVMMLRETVWQIGQRSTAVIDDVADHETRIRRVEDVRASPRLVQLEERLRVVESRLFPLPVLAVLFGAASLVIALITLGGK